MPDRRRIYLMRHAEAAYVDAGGAVAADPANVALTARGREQATKQAAILASVPFDRAVCSGLPRTRETATLVLAGRPTPLLEPIADFNEIRGGARAPAASSIAEAGKHDVGAWLARVANPWAHATSPDARFMDGERFVDFEARVLPAFRDLLADPDWTHLLLVLHGAVNRLLLNHVLNVGWQAGVSIEQDDACINILDVDRASPGETTHFLIRAVNVTGYDLNKSGMRLTTMEQTAQRLATLLGVDGVGRE
jgi:probable phosphoglycerate mutase